MEWIIVHNNVLSQEHCNYYNAPDLAHYLDDCILAGSPALEVCRHLGLPLHPKKYKGPSTSLAVLGIHLDSVTQTAQLQSDKLELPTTFDRILGVSTLV